LQSIVSGTSTERIVRTLLLMLLVDGFTIAYLWDGYVGYARQNAQELVRLLGLPPNAAPSINAAMTAAVAQRIVREVKPGGELTAITSIIGQPVLEHSGDAYYLGPGGWLKVQSSGSRIENITWTDGPKTEADQQWQRWIGYALAFGGLIVAVRLALVLATRLVLSNAGLQVNRRPLIPFDSITALRADPTGGSGCVELEYSLDGRSHRVRLDRYVFQRLPEFVATICERKGFTDPWAATTAPGRA